MLDTVLFDMGGTLEDISYSLETYERANKAIQKVITDKGIHIPFTDDAFWNRVFKEMNNYRKWAEEHEVELKPTEIWGNWCLKDMGIAPADVNKIAEELASTWESTYFDRELRPGVKNMLTKLKLKGYKLGVVSNTASLFHVFHMMDNYGIREYFETVTLSSVTGCRKPSKTIFEIALSEINSLPENSVYVGDTRSRDVIGPKNAGLARAIQIRSALTDQKDQYVTEEAPEADYIISDLSELPNIMDELRVAEN